MIAILLLMLIGFILYHDFQISNLRTKLSAAKSSIQCIRESEERFVERCIVQEEVLRFYADANNYEDRIAEDVENLVVMDSLIEIDQGDKARKILNNVILLRNKLD